MPTKRKPKKPHATRPATGPKARKFVREFARSLTKRQHEALRCPVALVALGAEKAVGVGVTRQVIGKRTWCMRVSFDCNGAPEKVGPAWHVEVWCLHANAERRLLVSEWSLADQEHAKAMAMRELRNVGHGEDLGVQVGDGELHVWKLSRVLEAAIATKALAMLAGARASAAEKRV